jgi:type II secretory pathway pseudopilin PulG
MRQGYTLAELLIVIAIVMVLALVSLAGFVNRRNRSHLDSTAAAMAGLLREAQSRSTSQQSSSAWGVRFENGDPPFFALFEAPYDASTTAGYHSLPVWVGYSTSSIAAGSHAEVIFSQISGLASGSSSISIHLIQNPEASSTVSVGPSGAVSY